VPDNGLELQGEHEEIVEVLSFAPSKNMSSIGLTLRWKNSGLFPFNDIALIFSNILCSNDLGIFQTGRKKEDIIELSNKNR